MFVKRGAGPKSSPQPFDFFPTHPRWTQALIDNVDVPHYVWECAAGDGAMVDVLEAAGHEVLATDITTGTDFLESTATADAVVTNPPFKHWDAFALHAIRVAPFVAMVAGWHLLAGSMRRTNGVFRAFPPSEILVIPQKMPLPATADRPAFKSMFNHAWVIWTRTDDTQIGDTTIRWVDA